MICNLAQKLELPLWLAKELCNRRRKIVSVDIPKAYKDGYREIFKADASVVDLHRLGPYFYEFGTKLLHFDFEENSQMASSMQEVILIIITTDNHENLVAFR